MSCPACPCPDSCLAWPAFCEWAAAGDPVHLAHIRARSAAGPAPPPSDRPAVGESLARVRAVKACPFRAAAGCGCGAAKCSLRGGQPVSWPDCFACIDAYGHG